MDAPKCRLCGKRHYGICPELSVTAVIDHTRPVSYGSPPVMVAANSPEFIAGPPAEQLTEQLTDNQLAASTIPGYMVVSRYKDTEKRRAYQRDYMRRKRGNG